MHCHSVSHTATGLVCQFKFKLPLFTLYKINTDSDSPSLSLSPSLDLDDCQPSNTDSLSLLSLLPVTFLAGCIACVRVCVELQWRMWWRGRNGVCEQFVDSDMRSNVTDELRLRDQRFMNFRSTNDVAVTVPPTSRREHDHNLNAPNEEQTHQVTSWRNLESRESLQI